MTHFLLDTNVVIDLLTDRLPYSLSAARLLEHAENGRTKLYLTTASYNNTYYIVKKMSSHLETIKILKNLESLTETIDVTKEAIQKALASNFADFEDAVQYFSAKQVKKMDAIVTRNTKDFKQSELPILTPDEALGWIENHR